MNKKVKIVQIRTHVGRTKRQIAILKTLGLGKIGQSKIIELDPQVCGMINKVKFLVNIEDL